MAGEADRLGVEPEVWLLVFENGPQRWWVRWLAGGPSARFTHVWALGWLDGARAWVFYDVGFDRTRILVAPDCEGADELVSARTRGATIVVMRRLAAGGRRRVRVGFWCVPAVAHLVGLGRVVLRPDALFRACLRAGGAVMD